jgi:hypothetical protein
MTENEIARVDNKPTAGGTQTNFLTMIEKLAANPDVDVSKIEKIMDLQERVLNRNAEQAFNADMVECQSEIRKVVARSKNEQTRSMYAKLDAIDAQTKPIYTKHGFALTFYEGETKKENHVRVMVDVLHRDGHSKTRYKDFPVDDTGIKGTVNKTAIHADSSSFTYGARKLTCLVFNIPTGDDDDGNAAGGAKFIDEQQQKTIKDLFQKAYNNDDKLIAAFFEHIGCTGIDDIPCRDFQKHKSALEAIAAKRPK